MDLAGKSDVPVRVGQGVGRIKLQLDVWRLDVSMRAHDGDVVAPRDEALCDPDTVPLQPSGAEQANNGERDPHPDSLLRSGGKIRAGALRCRQITICIPFDAFDHVARGVCPALLSVAESYFVLV